MKRLTFHSIRFASTLTLCGVLAFAAPIVARAQRGGAHFGGGHFASPGARVAAPRPMPAPATGLRPRGLAPLPGLRALPPRSFSTLGVPSFGLLPGTMPGYLRPITPRQPIRPVFLPPVLGFPFWGYGLGFGLNSFLWPNCDFFLTGLYGCGGWGTSPFGYALGYGYEPGYNSLYYPPSLEEPQIEIPPPPIYYYGESSLRFVQLYMKDGTVYNATDYWVVNGQLHFKTLEENGSKVVEHTVDFDQLDLQRTIDVNAQRGFRFVLRDEPIEDYLRDHASELAPEAAPPQPSSQPPGSGGAPQAPPLPSSSPAPAGPITPAPPAPSAAPAPPGPQPPQP